MEAGEYGLTRGMCFVARRLEVVAVAGLNFVVCFGWGGFLRVLFSFRTYMACCKYEALLPHLLPTSTRVRTGLVALSN